MERIRPVNEILVRLVPYGIALIISVLPAGVVRLIYMRAPHLLERSNHHVVIPLRLQSLQSLSDGERRKLLLFFAASAEWKVVQTPQVEGDPGRMEISKREQRSGELQLPENVIHSGEENPSQTFLTITLLSTSRETTKSGLQERSTPLTAESVWISVDEREYGDDRRRSRLVLSGEGIRVSVEERSRDLSRGGTREALKALESAVAVALDSSHPQTMPTVNYGSSSDCTVRRGLLGARYSVRGRQSLREPGFLFVEAVGKITGATVEGITSDHELVGGPEERVYYYDFEVMLSPFRSSDHRLRIMFKPLEGGETRELGSCTVEDKW